MEIGPGRGALTGLLLDAGAEVEAVEIDPRLLESLARRFEGRPLRLIGGDFLRLDLGLLHECPAVVSNLPYAVASPILQRLLDHPGWQRAVLMFQKEVADRLLASPGGPDYGLLTLSTRLKAAVEPVCGAPSACFAPPPKVDSAVVRLDRFAEPRLPRGLEEAALFRLARAAFQQRRKKAAKALASGLGLPKEAVEAAFQRSGIDLGARPQDISLEGYCALAGILSRPR